MQLCKVNREGPALRKAPRFTPPFSDHPILQVKGNKAYAPWLSVVRRYWRVAGVMMLLICHFMTRYAAERAIPLSLRNENMYSYEYFVSLNLLAGRGCYLSVLPDTPEAIRVREFIWLRRPALTREELNAYVRQSAGRVIHFDAHTHLPDVPIPEVDRPYMNGMTYTGRVLDLYLTALLWKLFGIRWDVLFTFYQLVSTATALLVFVIARKAAGYWAGVFALMLYMAAPIENQWTVRAIRDITPLWFSILAFAALFCFAGRFRSRALNLASYGVAGFAAALGCGWRLDSFVIAPIMIVVLMADGLARRAKLPALARDAMIFCCGMFLCLGFIRALSPGARQNPGTGFHVAYYGNAARSDLFGLENSLNIYFCDINTRVAAFYYADANALPDGGSPFLSPAYASACRAMYLRAFRFDAWHWVVGFPGFMFRALRATAIKDLPVNRDYYVAKPVWPKWILPLRRLLLEPLAAILPLLVLLGIAAVCFWTPFSMVSASQVFFILTYSAILFAVLPMYKNSGMLVLPMCLLGAIGVTSLIDRSKNKPHWRGGAVMLLSVTVVWLAAAGFAYFWSLHERTQQILDIRRAVAHAEADPAASVFPHLFQVRRPAGAKPDRAGYLLEIEAGAHPGALSFRQRREGSETRFYESEHALHPNRRQFFFFTAYQGALDHVQQYTATVVVDGDARLTSALRADLSRWKGLEVSTVFYDGERVAGSPSIGHASSLTIFGPGKADEDLLYPQDKFNDPAFRELAVNFFGPEPFQLNEGADSERFLFPLRLWTSGRSTIRIENGDTLRFETTGNGEQGWLMSPMFADPYERSLYFSIRYHLRKGRLALAILGPNGQPLGTCYQADARRRGDIWDEAIHVLTGAHEPFRVLVTNEPGARAEAEIIDIRVGSDSAGTPNGKH